MRGGTPASRVWSRRRLHALLRVFRKEVAASRPGERFRARYWRRHGNPRAFRHRVVFIGTGVATIAAGIVLLPAPGPGTLVILLGLALLAEESLLIAKGLDGSEVWARAAARSLAAAWRRTPVPLRAAGLVGILAGLAAVTFIACRALLES